MDPTAAAAAAGEDREEYHERRSDFKNNLARRAVDNIYNRHYAMLCEEWRKYMATSHGGNGGPGGAQGGAVSSGILLPKQKE
jgi:hypothetical protein